MICSIYKRNISHCLDSGKTLPNQIVRHLTRCQSCHQFYQDSQMLNQQLFSEGRELLRENQSDLNQRLISAFKHQRTPVKSKANRRLFIPVFASAVVLLFVAFGVIFQLIPTSSSPSDGGSLNVVSQINFKGEVWSDYFNNLESPFQSEVNGLRESVESASEFLMACLDFKIGNSGKKVN